VGICISIYLIKLEKWDSINLIEFIDEGAVATARFVLFHLRKRQQVGVRTFVAVVHADFKL
jgi:hypothetical protein